MSDDELVFMDEDSADEQSHKKKWKVIIVDDEPAVHDVTRLALDGFTFTDGGGLKFISAYSGKDAKELIIKHPDTAIMLLDVVMEHDHAGLEVAEFVRREAENSSVRVVLRTGQPGQAPERSVIKDYDINDYKEKTELTSMKLFTLVYSLLRSYRDIITLEENKAGLEKVLQASSSIFKKKSLADFSQAVLGQLSSLLHLDAVYCQSNALAASHEGNDFKVIAATGSFERLVGKDVSREFEPEVFESLDDTLSHPGNSIGNHKYKGLFQSPHSEVENLLYIDGVDSDLSALDRTLLDLFTHNVSTAFENVNLHAEIENTQREIVYLLGGAVETRSKETGNHVKRVAELSKLLALGYGVSAEEAEVIKLASPLHDLGKIGIPDHILNKPGKFVPDEWEIMKTHALLGYDMLKDSNKRILQAGAVIAAEHHERWDGNGYPYGKSGEDIHIYGRITALADVYDALGSDRCYKKAWPQDKVLALIKDERGKHFDPHLVDVFFERYDDILAICMNYVDVYEQGS